MPFARIKLLKKEISDFGFRIADLIKIEMEYRWIHKLFSM